MSSTNKTTNYELSQYVGADKPTYLGDYNSDMLKIDTQMKNNADDIASVSATATTANATANTALADASTAQTTADNANTSASNASQIATQALSKANANETALSAINAKSIVMLKPSEDKAYTSTQAYYSTKIDNLSINTSKGTHISLNENKEITFDSSVTYVKVWGNVNLNNPSTGTSYSIYVLRKNGNTSKGTYCMTTQQISQAWLNTVPIAPALIPIEAGDILETRIQFEAGGKTARIKATETAFLVEEI